MGHRLSKHWSSSRNSRTANKNSLNNIEIPTASPSEESSTQFTPEIAFTPNSDSNLIDTRQLSLGLHHQQDNSTNSLRFQATTVSVPVLPVVAVPAQISPRSVIIKIQLSKMEPGNGSSDAVSTSSFGSGDDNSIGNCESYDKNLNISFHHQHQHQHQHQQQPVLNFTITKNIICQPSQLSADINLNSLTCSGETTNGLQMTNNMNISGGNLCNELNQMYLKDESGNSVSFQDISNHNHSLSFSNCPKNQLQTSSTFGGAFGNCNNSFNGSSLFGTTMCTIGAGCSSSNLSRSASNEVSNNNHLESTNTNTSGGSIAGISAGTDTQHSNDLNMFTKDTSFVLKNICSEDNRNHCCQKKTSTSLSYPTKWRCCKCAFRDNLKTLNTSATASTSVLASPSSQSSSSSSTSCSPSPLSIVAPSLAPVVGTSVNNQLPLPPRVGKALSFSSKRSWANKFNCAKRTSSKSQEDDLDQEPTPPRSPTPVATSPASPFVPSALTPQPEIQLQLVPQLVTHPSSSRCVIVLSVNHPQPKFVVGAIDDCDERARRQRALEIEEGVEPPPGFLPQHQQNIPHIQTSQISPPVQITHQEIAPAIAAAIAGTNTWHMLCTNPHTSPNPSMPNLPNFGTVVHSQVDYIHCLVPDLEKITSSGFYWGKMDRYEAERLLEGKPEGTFLLRDSAQEEYLFSVTFRKYGRSLHARIEQFNHKFSFDCHDPGVYTAPTVTGLLEHYKDPLCVMFFEPMLTIPLNRNFSFSLQQLCRATIVSNITYDGINELQLPNTLKSYLKEYHYKLRVRVKPFDESCFTCR